MADFSYIKNAPKTKTGIGTSSDAPRGARPANYESTSKSELLLLEEVLKTLFPQYLNTDAKFVMTEPQSASATASYDPRTAKIKLGNMTFGGDVQFEGDSKKYSKSKFSQAQFNDNLLTALHELGHAQRNMKTSIHSSDDFSVPYTRKMPKEKYEKLQSILDFAAQEGYPSMSKNAFGLRSLEEFLVDTQAMKDVRDAGFELPKSYAKRLEQIEQIQAEVPWFDDYVKSQNRPDAPTLKEKAPNFMTHIDKIFNRNK